MIKKLLSILENICAVCLCVLTFSVFFQVLARMVFQISATWTTEIGRAMFLSIVFLGTPILIYKETQMAISMVKDTFSQHKIFITILYIIQDIFAFAFFITLSYGSYVCMRSEWTAPIPTVEWMTYGYLYLVMLIGSILMLVCKFAHSKKTYAHLFQKKEIM